ncbi:MAG: site-specific integrase [bacterium]
MGKRVQNGCVYKRGRVFWIKYSRDGRPYYENTHTDVKGDAKMMLQQRLGDIARGLPISPKMNQCRVDELLADVLADYTRNKRKTVEKTRRRIEMHLKPFFGGWKAAFVTADNILKFVDHRLAQSASNAEVNRELHILRRGYRLAVENGKLLSRPSIKMLTEDNVRQGFFGRAEFERVRAALPVYLRPLVTFAYLTGWRVRSEIQPLQWEQVDFDAGMVRLEVGTTKNKRGRTFPFGVLPELRALLEAQWQDHEKHRGGTGVDVPFVFHRVGKPIRDFYTAWDTACWHAGIATKDETTGKIVTNNRIPHDFRRTAVRNLVRRGVSEGVAMQLTGHKTAAIFRRYDIINEQDLIEGVEKLAGVRTVQDRLQKPRNSRLKLVAGGVTS